MQFEPTVRATGEAKLVAGFWRESRHSNRILKIRGVGEVKARDYLPDFISAVQQHEKGRR